jgi:hypothetical protein
MMQDTNEHWLQSIDRATLTPLVRSALRSETAEIVDWDYHLLHGGAGALGSLPESQGLYRFAGRGKDQAQAVTWSLILKYSRSLPHGGDPQGGLRERMAYQSGMLETLPAGLAVPRCFGVDELPGPLYLIWLEEITDACSVWPLERYGLAARHLGQLNGAFLTDQPLPSWSWLSRGWLRDQVAQGAPAIARMPDVLQHPLVRRCFPPDVVDGVLRLWDERNHFLDALDRLPQTFCHLDAFRRNLFACRGEDGEDQTIAIDWAFTGIDAVGHELVPLVIASVGFREVMMDAMQTLEEITFSGYVEGLREAGWDGDETTVWLGYAAASALRYGIGTISTVQPTLIDASQHAIVEQLFGASIEELADYWAGLSRHLVNLSDQARSLLHTVD